MPVSCGFSFIQVLNIFSQPWKCCKSYCFRIVSAFIYGNYKQTKLLWKCGCVAALWWISGVNPAHMFKHADPILITSLLCCCFLHFTASPIPIPCKNILQVWASLSATFNEILHWSLNRINYPGEPSLLLLLRGHAHHPSPTFVTHRVICSQLASMATLKITPVNQSEKIRWLSAAACLPTTPPPPLSAAHS